MIFLSEFADVDECRDVCDEPYAIGIPGFPGFRATIDGTIESCWKRCGPPDYWRMSDEWYERKTRVRSGYVEVGVRNQYGKQEWRRVHQLVMLAWVGPCPDGLECRHYDGNPFNNRPDNLDYSTHVENCRDKIRHGTNRRKRRAG